MPVIRAYYESMSEAGKAAKTLNKLGHRAYLDMMERFGGEFSAELDPFLSYNPVAGSSSEADDRHFSTSLLVNVSRDKEAEVRKRIEDLGGRIL